MGKTKKYIQVAILGGILLIGGWAISDSLFSDHKIPQVGDRAPDFTLQGLDGKEHRLSDYKGKVLLINFWGTFCPPCVREMPAMQRIYDKYKGEDFEVLAINLDESTVTVQSFVKQYKLTFPILMDKNTVRRKYGVSSYPTSFFVDSNGRITDIVIQEMTDAFIESRITALNK
ncbi:MAG TPA: thiol-disulfide oxidoreductase ResA [Bacilli bacterium]